MNDAPGTVAELATKPARFVGAKCAACGLSVTFPGARVVVEVDSRFGRRVLVDGNPVRCPGHAGDGFYLTPSKGEE